MTTSLRSNSRMLPIWSSEVVKKSKQGTRIIGICNGFQILTESGLLPGALMMNSNRKFICKDVFLRVENDQTVFT